jgi:RIO kinase 1
MDGPVIIDCGQGMTLDHPNAMEFLRRDITNINRYFRSLDVDVLDDKTTLKQITKGKK